MIQSVDNLSSQTSLTAGAYIALVICCLVAGGCGQRRYEPAKWRPPLESDSLPVTLSTSDGTLPSRGSLPARAGGGSLPLRDGDRANGSLPRRDSGRVQSPSDRTPRASNPTDRSIEFYSPKINQQRYLDGPLQSNGTLPGRSRTGTGTLPYRSVPVSGTLPSRRPDHLSPNRFPRRSNTLPQRRRTQPTGTLPSR